MRKKQRSDPEIGKRAYLEVYRLFTTQVVAGKKIGTDRSIISNWSKGHAPSAFSLQQLAKCGADVVYILTGERSGGDGK